jgi:hypothetical protein
MQTDVSQLGFNFAKEIATQLITLSTGLLALSVTFTKDILKGVPRNQETTLKTAWGVLVSSIVLGVWTLSALTGTLMPSDPSMRPDPLRFDSNVRLPALGQVVLFLLGTFLLVWVYGKAAMSHGADEYQLFLIGQEELSGKLNDLTSQGWEIVTIALRDDSTSVSLMKRARSAPLQLNAPRT